MTYSPPQAILFDLDDTLFDYRHSDHSGLQAVWEQYAALQRVTLDDYFEAAEMVFDELWPPVLTGELTVDAWVAQSFQRLFTRYNMDGRDATSYQTVAQIYHEAFQAARRVVPGAIELLEALQNRVKIGIVTNHLVAEQREKLAYCKLDHLVDFMVCADEAGVAKPHSHIFEMALELAGAKPQHTVMVGDSWSADVMGGSRMGMRCVWINVRNTAIPDAGLATEIMGLEPVETVLKILLGSQVKANS